MLEVQLVDLQEVNLPVFDEPNHPRLAKYERAHSKAWSATVKGLDAFAFMTPEYNYGPPPALLNALDFLFHEWACKPAIFVSYGGVSAGLRSVQMSKLTLTALKVMPLPEGVPIPFVANLLENGVLKLLGKTKDIAQGRTKRIPVRDYLLRQGRFAHFVDEDIEYFQSKVDEMWDRWLVPGVIPFRREVEQAAPAT